MKRPPVPPPPPRRIISSYDIYNSKLAKGLTFFAVIIVISTVIFTAIMQNETIKPVIINDNTVIYEAVDGKIILHSDCENHTFNIILDSVKKTDTIFLMDLDGFKDCKYCRINIISKSQRKVANYIWYNSDSTWTKGVIYK